MLRRHCASAPTLRDHRFAVENDIHVVADAAFLDDDCVGFEGAFLGMREQFADLGRGEPLKSLDVLGELEQQALQIVEG